MEDGHGRGGGDEEKSGAHRRRHARNNRRNSKPDEVSENMGPNPEMLTAMRARTQRPDGALDTRAPAFGL